MALLRHVPTEDEMRRAKREKVPIGIVSGRPLTWYDASQERPEIGKGATADVRAYSVDANTIVAVKRATEQLELGVNGSLLDEMSMMSNLAHPNVLALLDAFALPSMFALVLPYAAGGTLGQAIRAKSITTEHEKKLACAQLLRAVAYLHDRNVLHGDLKPDNVLIFPATGGDCTRYALADFGLAFHLPGDDAPASFQLVFTLWYRPPEVSLYDGYTKRGDSWALGCIIAEVLLGHVLLPGESVEDQLHRIVAAFGTPTEQSWPGVSMFEEFDMMFARWKYEAKSPEELLPGLSAQARAVVLSLLVVDPKRRASPAEALASEWFDEVRPLLETPCLRASAPTPKRDDTSVLLSRVSHVVTLNERAVLETERNVSWTYMKRQGERLSDDALALARQLYDELIASRPTQAEERDVRTRSFLPCAYIASLRTLEGLKVMPTIELEASRAMRREGAVEVLLVHGPDLNVATSYDVLEAMLASPYGQTTRNVARTLLQCSYFTLLGTRHGAHAVALMCLVLACSFANEPIASHEEVIGFVGRDELGATMEEFGGALKHLWVADGALTQATRKQRRMSQRQDVDVDEVLAKTPVLASLLGLRTAAKD
jgi:serine/threonine protein kinase